MDEIDKIQLKNAALLAARQYLLKQAPSDLVAITEITESIVDLAGRNVFATSLDKIPQVSAFDQRRLEESVSALRYSILNDASVSEILEHAKGVFDIVPWPPEGFKIEEVPFDLRPWPPGFKVR